MCPDRREHFPARRTAILNALRTDRCKTLVCFLTEDENQLSSDLVEAAKDGTAAAAGLPSPAYSTGRRRFRSAIDPTSKSDRGDAQGGIHQQANRAFPWSIGR